jgi:cell division protein FtsB
MLCVLAALLYLYLGAGIRMFSTWRQSSRDQAAVSAMQHEHQSLVQQHERLSALATVEAEARRLGMMRPGEQPYVVSGLPTN